MTDNINKFYKGTIDEFKAWLIALSKDTTEEGKRKYADIKLSVVYISPNYDRLPDNLDDFQGAIYVNGAIIAGASLKWDNSDSSVFPPLS